MPELSYRCIKCRHRLKLPELKPPFPVTCDECGEGFKVSADAPLTGRVIGGYHVLRKINTGGMGMVYLATQLSLRRKVALKVMSDDLAHDEKAREQFINGAISEARITHPNIVQVFDVGFQQGICFISMEFVSGVSLRQMILREGQMSVPEAIDIAKQMLKALGKAHRERVIHRDIKPENILIDREGTVKITDFGLAAILEKSGHARDIDRGTPHYMSPEHARREPVDTRTDIYSVGATIYHMLAGRPPYAGKSARQVLELVKKEPPVPLSMANPSVPDNLSQIIDAMMARNPDERYASAEDALESLEVFENSLSSQIDEFDVFGSNRWEEAFESAVGEVWGDEGMPDSELITSRRSDGNIWKIAVSLVMVGIALALVIYALFGGEPTATPTPSYIIEDDDEDGRDIPPPPQVQQQQAPEVSQAQRYFNELREKARDLAEEGRFMDAAAQFHEFPRDLLTETIEVRLNSLERRYFSLAGREAENLSDKARQAVDDGRLDDAEEIYRRMMRIGLTRSNVEAEDGLERLRHLRAEADEEKALRAEINYIELLKNASALARERKYDEAENLLQEAAEDEDMGPVADRIRHEIHYVKRARNVFQAGIEGLKENPGVRLHVGRNIGSLVEVDGENLELETTAGRVKVPAAELSANDVMRFGSGKFDQTDPDTMLTFAAFFLCEGQHGNAVSETNRAARRGAQVPEAMRNRLEVAAQSFDKQEDEAWAAMLIFRLRNAINNDQLMTARDLLDTLREEYSETDAYRRQERYMRDAQNWLNAIRPTRPVYVPWQ